MKAGRLLSAFSFILLFTVARSTSPQPHLDPRARMPLGLPNLPPGLFITYTGVLTGSFQLDPSQLPFDAAQCAGDSGTYFFNDTENSTVRVGLNPPSVDTNPIYFMVQQGGPPFLPLGPEPEPASPTTTKAPTKAAAPIPWTPSLDPGMPTLMPIPIFPDVRRAFHTDSGALDIRQEVVDPVLPPGSAAPGGFKNLLFASLYTICARDSQPCGIIRTADRGTETYNPLRMLDLSSPGLLGATTSSEATGLVSYTLRGDQSTWIGNETIDWSGLEFSPPANYTPISDPPEPEACMRYRYPPLVWNATTPFTYDLTFSNTSATISLVLTAPLGTAKLRLEAVRTEEGADSSARAIQIGAGAGGAPRWSFVNGTGFHFDGVTPVANSSVADAGLLEGQDGLGSGAAAVWAGRSGQIVVVVASVFAVLLM